MKEYYNGFLVQMKHPLKPLKKVVLVVLISETFILVLMVSGTEMLGKNLKIWKILTKSIMVLIIMMLA